MTERRKALIAAGAAPRLPSEYQEVEWIQTVRDVSAFEWDGIPGYVPYFESKLYDPTQESWTGFAFSRDINNALIVERVSGANPVFQIKNVQSGVSLVSTASVYSPATQKYLADGWYVNDVLLGSLPVENVYPTKFVLGAQIIASHTALRQVRFFYMNMYASNGTPLMSLVPCYRKSDGRKGIYDTVGGTFNTGYTRGTPDNSFIVGPDV